jgi:hypothetical protein
MTTTQQHIGDLGFDTWAAVTRRAAEGAVTAVERLGKQPPPKLVAVAAMTEHELVERRTRSGQGRKRHSALMQLVEMTDSFQSRRPGPAKQLMTKRELCLRLMRQSLTSSEACRQVGIDRRIGPAPPMISARFLSEEE